MATVITESNISSTAWTPLLEAEDTVGSAVDYKGRQARRSTSGGWRSALFIIGVEVAERYAYYGISSDLISYLTGPLGQSTATAAANVNAWSGASMLSPFLGAFLADSYLGRYRTIILASLLYVLGLGLLTIATLLPYPRTFGSQNSAYVLADSPPVLQIIVFFFALYLVAIAQGGHKPCVQAFGADQFDGRDPEECKAKSSFFNWWYFGMNVGIAVTFVITTYIQDNLSWSLGFGIPCLVMVFALVAFLFGTATYRFPMNGDDETSPFVRIGRVFVKAVRNCRIASSTFSVEEESQSPLHYQGSQQFKFLNKALLTPGGLMKDGKDCSISEVEEAKAILRLFPIWATCLVYGIVFSQSSTLFTKQGVTMNRSITASFMVPAASLQSLIALTIVFLMPMYDKIVVPTARAITRNPSGITMLQRIGTGIFLSVVSMVVAAVVERKRLETARAHGLVDKPDATVPMSVAWLIPQYLIFGIQDAFGMVGLQEFFYDQVPGELKSIGMALYLSIFGTASFLSSFLISVIGSASIRHGGNSWFSNNLNKAHLDYFYWLLAGLNAVAFAAFLYFARSYAYNRGSNI